MAATVGARGSVHRQLFRARRPPARKAFRAHAFACRVCVFTETQAETGVRQANVAVWERALSVGYAQCNH